MRKTKIICTMGPALDDETKLRKVMQQDMDCARFNFSHGNHAEQKTRMDRVRRIREELDLPIALLLDTKGPEMRVRKFAESQITLEAGMTFTLYADDSIMGDTSGVSITYPYLAEEVSIGTRILLDDGLIELGVSKIEGKDVICTVISGGPLSNNKGINIPGINLDVPYINETDRADILFGIEQDIDFIAASFVRTADDVRKLRRLLDANGGKRIKIISKIENRSGLDNLDEILAISDGIMIARGDMGVEIPFPELPPVQKDIIKKCYRAGKFSVTATQMLESMTHNPRPTRAEVSDVANAIYDGTTAIMLSGETAAGKYPVEAARTMATIAEYTEQQIDYKKRFATNHLTLSQDIPNAIGSAACESAYFLDAKAIVSMTMTGRSAHMISRYRPACPIIAAVSDPVAARTLNLAFGVRPVLAEVQPTVSATLEHGVELAFKTGLVKKGDLIILTSGNVIDTQTAADTMHIREA
ncbi:pyruvate kinase [Parasphaerochaeta coccoides]|uniref:Pyruvate kinase n=1 Tax=Parasphaerochaeta coccoides (strain ATCC BAA-1237 / DSM 17374 / SPN1) TaxID=760011 RepID=F4GHP1_PARC1|nr:pyruvate kinase [Parasphaerochaeta coccoides]AEC01579.1 pyruvate kinase [Parasphaerochaeta coccoides DSM 17374]